MSIFSILVQGCSTYRGQVKKHCSGKMSGKGQGCNNGGEVPLPVGYKEAWRGFFCFTGPLIIPRQPAHPFHSKLPSYKEAFPLGHRLREVLTCQHTSWGRGSRVTHPWLRSSDFYKREMQGVLKIYNRETWPKLAQLSDNWQEDVYVKL